jgi:hypothetical protein
VAGAGDFVCKDGGEAAGPGAAVLAAGKSALPVGSAAGAFGTGLAATTGWVEDSAAAGLRQGRCQVSHPAVTRSKLATMMPATRRAVRPADSFLIKALARAWLGT